MLKDESVQGSDKYKEYMLIEGVVQCVGDTSVDLTDYAKTVDIPTTVAELTDSGDYAKTSDVNDSISALQTNKANASDLNAHTNDADIHVTVENKTLWNTVDDKVNKTSILTALDKSATGEQVYSASVINTELDLKANDNEVIKKTDIKTTLDENSTNNDVCGGKAIFDAIKNAIFKKLYCMMVILLALLILQVLLH